MEKKNQERDSAHTLHDQVPAERCLKRYFFLSPVRSPVPPYGGAVTAVTHCCANCVEPSSPQHWGSDLPFFVQSGPAGWLSLLVTNAGDVETNPGPATLNKRVWTYDICYKQIHVRRQISIRCNRIEQWVHLRCAGVRQVQYTDTWTCHLHRESRLTIHTNITPPHPSRPWSKAPTHSLPTPYLHHPHHHIQNSFLFPQNWYITNPILLSTHHPLHPRRPS